MNVLSVFASIQTDDHLPYTAGNAPSGIANVTKYFI